MRVLALFVFISIPLHAATHFIVPNSYSTDDLLRKKDCKAVRLFAQEKLTEIVGLDDEGVSSKCIPLGVEAELYPFKPYAVVIETQSDEDSSFTTFSWETAYRLEKRPRDLTRTRVEYKVENGVVVSSEITEKIESDYRVQVPGSFKSTAECQETLEDSYNYLKSITLSTYHGNTVGHGKFLLDGKCVTTGRNPTHHKFFLLVVPKKN